MKGDNEEVEEKEDRLSLKGKIINCKEEKKKEKEKQEDKEKEEARCRMTR